jgi:hypothetical protein
MATGVRDTASQASNHASVAESMDGLSARARAVQSQASSAVGLRTFYGPADAAAIDVGTYTDLVAAGALPTVVRTRQNKSPGAPQSLIPPKQSLVLAPSARAIMAAEGVTAARPERYGVKAMRIGLDMDPGYWEEIQADIARPTGKTKVELAHLNAWLRIPDIILLVNPKSLDWTMNNTVQETRTRGGFLQEFWGSELDTLAASGQTAVAYVARNNARTRGSQGGGLTIRDLRSDSAGYRNLRRLVDIYRSNGVIYGMRAMGNYATGSEEERPAYRKALLYNGCVRIFYDGVTYSGYFESFEVRESGDAPYWLDWSFTFKVETHVGEGLKVYDSGKYLDPASGPAEFSSLATNRTGQRNM